MTMKWQPKEETRISCSLPFVLLLVVLLITGCSYSHVVLFENHTKSVLSIVLSGQGVGDKVTVDPCSVILIRWGGGPGPRQLLTVKAFYGLTYDLAYQGKLLPDPQQGSWIYKVTVMDAGLDTCPFVETGIFQVVFINNSKNTAKAALDDKFVTNVSSGEVITIPIKGDITNALHESLTPLYDSAETNHNLRVYYRSNENLLRYDLGQIPSYVITINDVR